MHEETCPSVKTTRFFVLHAKKMPYKCRKNLNWDSRVRTRLLMPWANDNDNHLVTMTENLTRNLTQTRNIGMYLNTYLFITSNRHSKPKPKKRGNKLTM